MDKKTAQYLLQKTQKDYNEIAIEFSRSRQKFWPELKFLYDFVKENEKILDVGCGNGRLYEFLAPKKPRYFGIDFSEKLIALAKKRYKERNPKPIFLTGNALSLPFSSDFFDKVFAIAFLHHIPSKEYRLRCLKEMRRVLKKEGELFLTVWNLWQLKYFPLILKETLKKIFFRSKLDFFDIFVPFGKKTFRFYHCFRKRELVDLVKKAGFSIKEVQVLKRNGRRTNIYLRAKKS